MGRPLNSRHFGDPKPGSNEIKIQFHNGTASVNGWIVKQLGSKRFRCTDGTNTADCILVNKPSAAIGSGEMSITVKDDAGALHQVLKVTGRKVTVADGPGTKTLPWNFAVSTTDGAAEMEEAGDDVALTNADNFEGD